MFVGDIALDEPRIKPSRWRKQHGKIESVDEQIQDSAGNIGAPYRGLTLLEDWERSGRITKEELAAGNEFHRQFQMAAFDPLAAADMGRVGGARGPIKHRGAMGARDAVNDAVKSLGGRNTPAGMGAWFVLGCDCSIREWLARQSWRGKPMHPTMAAGVLIGALGVLVSWKETLRY